MKLLRNILSGVIWALVGMYAAIIILLHIPAVQRGIAGEVASAIENKFGTNCKVGRVDLGFLNRLIIDDVTLYDLKGKEMLQASRLSVKVDYIPLIKGRISISSAQIFGLKADLYKEKQSARSNYQFVLDSLAPKDTTHTPLDLRINTLIVRHGCIRYDRYDAVPTPNRFNLSHINISDISAHIILPRLTDDKLIAQIKKLSFKEASGLDLKNLSFSIDADKQKAMLKDFNLRLPHTDLNISRLAATYRIEDGKPVTSSLRYDGDIADTKIASSDFACFNDALGKIRTTINVSMAFSGTGNSFGTNNLKLYSDKGNVSLNAAAHVYNWDSAIRWNAEIKRFDIKEEFLLSVLQNISNDKQVFSEMANRLGDISIKLKADGTKDETKINGSINTDIGNTLVTAETDSKNVSGHVKTDGLNIGRLLADDKFGNISVDMDINGTVGNGKISSARVNGDISQFEYNTYSYSDIHTDLALTDGIVNGEFSMNDRNGQININGAVNVSKDKPSANITASIKDFAPRALKLTDKWKDAVFCADIETDIAGNSFDNINGWISIKNFTMKSNDADYRLNSMTVKADTSNGSHYINVSSDFCDATLSGKCNYATVTGSVMDMIGEKIPVVKPQNATKHGGNDFTLRADILKTDWLNALLGIPLHVDSEFRVNGMINDNAGMLYLHTELPRLTYDKKRYDNAYLDVSLNPHGEESDDALRAEVRINKHMDNGEKMKLSLNADAGRNDLKTDISWKSNSKRPMGGTVSSVTKFFKTSKGKNAAHIHIVPSEIECNDTVWNVGASDIVYSKKELYVNNFNIRHNRQHIIVSGLATESANDSITADLRDVDINYILNLINFHSVEFDGLATGRVCAKSVFGNPDAKANLTVRNFLFEHGRMGTLFAKAAWNNSSKQIDIDAVADDGPDHATIIKGYVSPERNYIDLGFDARGTRLEFLESFCGSFMKNVDAYTTGKLRLSGNLSSINLTGEAVANGKLDVKPLNTTYWLKNDTIRLIPDEIIFRNAEVTDRDGNSGFVNGMLHHKHLTKLTFDLNVEARNLLAYDFHDYGNNTFYGTVYATGTCDIKGRSGSIDFDVNVTPGKGSFIEYNAASPNAINNNEFITWNDKSPVNDSILTKNSVAIEKEQETVDIPSDIRINFLINTTPDFTLRVLMDQQSGDHIALNGSGILKASYYNKGSFDMFGNYAISHGVYKLTIQNIIKKDFIFQNGSSIVFGGDPYNAALNLKAQYTVNGVSLADLHIGNSFSTNNVRVDCFMNIGGTPQLPTVDFDIDLPTVNADAKHMVRSLINSEEEMNQQVIYLLAVGRFYLQDNNNTADEEKQSQTSLAMQSLLSGTVSQQINSLLSSVINSNNWNLGANISTGDEGWNNAEYEGLLSGRLLNNRLLINGQFGYRDNANATTSFIGDFDIRYLLLPNGNLAVKMYNQTNDRYFTKSSLNTQGIGIIMRKDFNSWRDLIGKKKKKKKVDE